MWLRDNSNYFPGLVDTKLIHAMGFQLHKASANSKQNMELLLNEKNILMLLHSSF